MRVSEAVGHGCSDWYKTLREPGSTLGPWSMMGDVVVSALMAALGGWLVLATPASGGRPLVCLVPLEQKNLAMRRLSLWYDLARIGERSEFFEWRVSCSEEKVKSAAVVVYVERKKAMLRANHTQLWPDAEAVLGVTMSEYCRESPTPKCADSTTYEVEVQGTVRDCSWRNRARLCKTEMKLAAEDACAMCGKVDSDARSRVPKLRTSPGATVPRLLHRSFNVRVRGRTRDFESPKMSLPRRGASDLPTRVRDRRSRKRPESSDGLASDGPGLVKGVLPR